MMSVFLIKYSIAAPVYFDRNGDLLFTADIRGDRFVI